MDGGAGTEEREITNPRLHTLYKRERAAHCECACFVHEIRGMWGIWGCAWFGFRNLGYEETREETPTGFRGRSWV